jgi:hypothetical protein
MFLRSGTVQNVGPKKDQLCCKKTTGHSTGLQKLIGPGIEPGTSRARHGNLYEIATCETSVITTTPTNQVVRYCRPSESVDLLGVAPGYRKDVFNNASTLEILWHKGIT